MSTDLGPFTAEDEERLAVWVARWDAGGGNPCVAPLVARLLAEREGLREENEGLRRLVNDLAVDVGGVRFAPEDPDWTEFDGSAWVPLASYDPVKYRLLLSCTRPDRLAAVLSDQGGDGEVDADGE